MIYDYFTSFMMWYKNDPNPMCYIRIRPVLVNLLEWDLEGTIKENQNLKNPIRTPNTIEYGEKTKGKLELD